MSIHPTAVVESGAELGAEVRVGPFAYIQAGANVGAGCVIGPHAVIYRGTTLGPRVRIHAHVALGDWPQDLSFKDEESFVRIGADCVLREGVTIHRGTKLGTTTVLGDGCFLMANSHVGHNCQLGPRVILANGVLLAGYVQVGAGAFLSGNVLVHQFTRVGRLAMLQGGSAVSKDVPPFCMTHGLSGNFVGGLNVIGLRRAGLTPEQRLQVKRAFLLLYRSGLNVTQAVARIRQEVPEGPAWELCVFIEESQRGICAYGSGVGGEADAG
ncbi:MAG: acyl-ACP--UDP-N-acetylglucosamine O-acyltransferase [Kiritimatiellaeota bacterium]|nr:acyl-ACP--UDP-N-acetylglucosamine O-acyltransferase [Kiritimatiellota bacterium]